MDDIRLEISGIDEISMIILEVPGLLTPITGLQAVTTTTQAIGFPASSILSVDQYGNLVSSLDLPTLAALLNPYLTVSPLPPVTVPPLVVTSSAPINVGFSFSPVSGVTYSATLQTLAGVSLATVATTGSGSFHVPGGSYQVALAALRTSDNSAASGAPVSIATGIATPTVTRAAQVPFLFSNRTNVAYLPAATIGVYPVQTPDWPDQYVLATTGAITVPMSAAMIVSKPTVQATVELAIPNTTGILTVTDGERAATATVVDGSATWTVAESNEMSARCEVTIDACRKPGDSTYLPFGYIYPGNYYKRGQWSWDSAWACGIAAKMSSAYIGYAKGWAKSWATHIVAPGDPAGRAGATPLRVGTALENAAGVEDTGPQQWLWGWAVRRIYQADGDLTFVNAMYPWLKAAIVYFDNVDADSSGLYSISGTTSGSVLDTWNTISTRRADVDGTTVDSFWMDLNPYPADPNHTFRTSCVDPELSSLLARNATEMAALATAIGNTGDAAIWTAKAASITAAIRAYCWDEKFNRFQWIERAELARSCGTVGATNAGLASITITSTVNQWLPSGKLLLPGGVVAQPLNTVELIANIPTVVALTSPLSGAVTAGSVTYRRFAAVDNLGAQAAPLFANVATAPQATAVKNHLFTTLDGATPTAFEVFFGSSVRGNQHTETEWIQWKPLIQPGALVNATSVTIAAGTTGIRIGYRVTDTDNFVYGNTLPPSVLPLAENRQWWHPEWEKVTASRPLVVTVTWIRSGTTAPIIKLFDNTLTLVSSLIPAVPAGADGQPVTATVTFTNTCIPGVVELAGNSASVTVKKVKITTMPKGWTYNAPNGGFTCTPRFSRTHLSKPLDRFVEINVGPYLGIDYWKGDIWPPQNYWAIIGLHNYGFTEAVTAAKEYARQVLLDTRLWNTYWNADQGFWERSNSFGYQTGSNWYAWGCLPYIAGLETGAIPQPSVIGSLARIRINASNGNLLNPSGTVAAVNDRIQTFIDRGSLAINGTQTVSGNQPQLQQVSGQNVIAIDATRGDHWNFPDNSLDSNFAAGGEVFIVEAVASVGVASGHWAISGAGSADYYTFGGAIYDSCGSTVRRDAISPGSVDLTQFNIYSVRSAPGEHTFRLNGNVIATYATNTVKWQDTAAERPIRVGVSRDLQTGTRSVKEFIVTNLLTDPQRTALIAELKALHGIA